MSPTRPGRMRVALGGSALLLLAGCGAGSDRAQPDRDPHSVTVEDEKGDAYPQGGGKDQATTGPNVDMEVVSLDYGPEGLEVEVRYAEPLDRAAVDYFTVDLGLERRGGDDLDLAWQSTSPQVWVYNANGADLPCGVKGDAQDETVTLRMPMKCLDRDPLRLTALYASAYAKTGRDGRLSDELFTAGPDAEPEAASAWIRPRPG